MLRENSKDEKKLKVLMMPDYRIDNPYQTLLANALKTEEVEVFFPYGYRRILPIFRLVAEKKGSYSLVHLHWISPYIKGNNIIIKTFYSLKFLLDVFLVRLSGTKIVWTVHNKISHDSIFPRLELWTCRALSQLVDVIILHHYSMVNLIANEYRCTLNKIAVIQIGHYRDVYPPPINISEARKILNLPPTGLIYLHQGMIRPYKGVENLIRSWGILNTEFQDHTLLIAGRVLDDSYAVKLQDLAKGVQGLHLQLEFLEDKLMSLLFSASNIVVLPFEKILTSSSLLVAMSFGKPVIAPDLGGTSEMLGQANTLLYNPEKPNALIEAIRKSTKVDLERLSRLTIEECDRFGWDKIAKKTREVYERYAYSQS